MYANRNTKDTVVDKTISASEVNRFCYCPWQWYYEKQYGTAELKQMKKELNAEMGFTTPSGESAFEKGQKFHNGYAERYERKILLRRLLFTGVFFVIAAVGIWIYLGL